MNPVFPIFLIVFSFISLTVPALLLWIQLKKLDSPARQLIQRLLAGKKYLLLVSSLCWLAVLIGSFGLLASSDWSKSLVLTGLSVLLGVVWLENLGKIIYFKKLKTENAAPIRQEVEAELVTMLKPFKEDVMEQVSFDDEFYDLMARKNISKAVGRIVVGSAMFVPAIYYLLKQV